jgi:hypothetical protein
MALISLVFLTLLASTSFALQCYPKTLEKSDLTIKCDQSSGPSNGISLSSLAFAKTQRYTFQCTDSCKKALILTLVVEHSCIADPNELPSIWIEDRTFTAEQQLQACKDEKVRLSVPEDISPKNYNILLSYYTKAIDPIFNRGRELESH